VSYGAGEEMKLFLDMDGVLADFIGQVHATLKIPYNIDRYPYELGRWDTLSVIANRSDGRFTRKDVFAATDVHEFWEYMPWTYDGKTILKSIKRSVKSEERFICTSPMARPYAWSGKIAWLNKNKIYNNIIIMSASKSLLAKHDCMLIDDKDSNVDEFIAAGGKAFLIPRPWNRRFAEWQRRYDYFDEMLDAIEKVKKI
jgi:hypothetical protein